MVQTSTFGTNNRKTSPLEDDLSKSQRKWEEELLPSVEKIEKMSEEEMFNRQLEHLKEQTRETEGIRLQQKLKDILDGLRSRYRVPYQIIIKKDKSFKEMEDEARSINAYRATTFTFKFFYILSIIIFGFFLHWIYYQFPPGEPQRFLSFGFIAAFLIGLFPIKNVIYLPRPAKSVCDTCERIESFVSKMELSDEDTNEMKKLKKHGNLLIFLSVLSKILNLFFILTVLYVSTSIDISDLPPKTLDPIFIFSSCILMTSLLMFAIFLKFSFVQIIVENQYSPEIIRLFL